MTTHHSADPTPRDGIPASRGAMAEDMANQKGATALARRLEHYWHEAGYPAARFWAVPVDERFPKIGTYEIYGVASNLVNGLPPRYLKH